LRGPSADTLLIEIRGGSRSRLRTGAAAADSLGVRRYHPWDPDLPMLLPPREPEFVLKLAAWWRRCGAGAC
jgi:hypothetical protein